MPAFLISRTGIFCRCWRIVALRTGEIAKGKPEGFLPQRFDESFKLLHFRAIPEPVTGNLFRDRNQTVEMSTNEVTGRCESGPNISITRVRQSRMSCQSLSLRRATMGWGWDSVFDF